MDEKSAEEIWARVLAENKPEPVVISQLTHTPKKNSHPFLSLILCILMFGPLLLSIQTPISGDFPQEEEMEGFRIQETRVVNNVTIGGEEYDIYRWELPPHELPELSDLDEYAELQFSMVRGAHAGYHFSLICDSFYECPNDAEFEQKQWTEIQAHPYTWTLHTDWGNRSTFFVYIEEGEDMLLAVHEDVEVNNWASVYIEVRG